MADLSFSINFIFFGTLTQLKFSSKDSDGYKIYEGELILQDGYPIDIGEAINNVFALLGGDAIFTPRTLFLSDDLEIDFFAKKNASQPSSQLAVSAQIGHLEMQYGMAHGNQPATGDGGGNPSSFFFQLDLKDLLKAIPNVNTENLDINGYFFLGFSSGQTVWFIPTKDGGLNTIETHKGIYFGGQLKIGDQEFTYIPSKKSSQAITTQNELQTNGNATKGIKWIDLKKKKLGPITMRSLGFQIKKQGSESAFALLIKADINLGPLTLSLLGVGMSIKPKEMFHHFLDSLSFEFYGLGLAFKKGDLTIAGIFEKQPGREPQYLGGVMVKTKSFALTGIGAYGKVNDHKSLFGFLYLGMDLGGPPSFFVEGLALAFGYNRQILVPDISQVQNFPLVSYALQGEGPDLEGDGNPLVAFSEKLGQFIVPKENNYFFGIGVKFQTYKLVDSFAMLIIAAGEDLEFILLGLSKLALPPNFSEPIVYVEIALKAEYSVKNGLLAIEGMLTNNSYVFCKDAHLTGGFAFYSWFKDFRGGASAGEFVITAGGYHPEFDVPSYYPKVPRLGVHWAVNSNLNVSGKMYQALTSRAVMAGAALHACWKSGGLEASFDMSVDFLIQYKPFHYDASLHVSIRAGFHVHVLFYHKYISIDIGADLHIWGPSFSGHADLHVRVCHVGFSFSIDFGSGSQQTAKLDKSDFEQSFLPKPSDVLGVSALSGLIKRFKESDGSELWLINPKDFKVSFNTVIPFTKYTYDGGGAVSTTVDKYSIPVTNYDAATSTFKVSLKYFDPKGILKNNNGLTVDSEIPTKNFATAVWNITQKSSVSLNGKQTNPISSGLVLVPKSDGQDVVTVQPVAARVFKFDRDERLIPAAPTGHNNFNYQNLFIMGNNYPESVFKSRTKEEYLRQEVL